MSVSRHSSRRENHSHELVTGLSAAAAKQYEALGLHMPQHEKDAFDKEAKACAAQVFALERQGGVPKSWRLEGEKLRSTHVNALNFGSDFGANPASLTAAGGPREETAAR